MTKHERETLALIQTPEAQGKAYDLAFYPWREQDVRRVVMLRHQNPAPEPDDFTIHDAETGRNLGWGEDKQEAESEAMWRLSEPYKLEEDRRREESRKLSCHHS